MFVVSSLGDPDNAEGGIERTLSCKGDSSFFSIIHFILEFENDSTGGLCPDVIVCP